MAGGVALNCVANGRLLREGLFKDIWIQPAAGDAGGALGAALMVCHQFIIAARCRRRATTRCALLPGAGCFEDAAVEGIRQGKGLSRRKARTGRVGAGTRRLIASETSSALCRGAHGIRAARVGLAGRLLATRGRRRCRSGG